MKAEDGAHDKKTTGKYAKTHRKELFTMKVEISPAKSHFSLNFWRAPVSQLARAVGDKWDGGLNFTIVDLRLRPRIFGFRLPRPYFSASAM